MILTDIDTVLEKELTLNKENPRYFKNIIFECYLEQYDNQNIIAIIFRDPTSFNFNDLIDDNIYANTEYPENIQKIYALVKDDKKNPIGFLFNDPVSEDYALVDFPRKQEGKQYNKIDDFNLMRLKLLKNNFRKTKDLSLNLYGQLYINKNHEFKLLMPVYYSSFFTRVGVDVIFKQQCHKLEMNYL